MEDLKSYCQNFGERGCHPQVARWRFGDRLEEGESIPIQPPPSVLDEFCKNCDSHQFAVDKEICLICDSHEVESTGGRHRGPGMAWQIGYRCLKCGTKFWIFKT